MIQVRDPKTDADDQWAGFSQVRYSQEEAAAAFRRMRGFHETYPVEVMNGDGQSRILGKEPPPPPPRRPKRGPAAKGGGAKGINRQQILSHLKNGPMTANQILEANFGPEALATFLRLRAMLGEIYGMAREGVLSKDGELYKK